MTDLDCFGFSMTSRSNLPLRCAMLCACAGGAEGSEPRVGDESKLVASPAPRAALRRLPGIGRAKV